MAKITPEDDGSLRFELTAEDGREEFVTVAIETIVTLARTIEKRPHGQAERAKDRGGYYRYSEIERALELIRSSAVEALTHIKLLDFPESAPSETKELQ